MVEYIYYDDVDVDIDALEPVDVSENDLTEADVSIEGEVIEIPIKDHRGLTHRDADNQHPISAITDLESALDDLETESIDTLEIDEIFNFARL